MSGPSDYGLRDDSTSSSQNEVGKNLEKSLPTVNDLSLDIEAVKTHVNFIAEQIAVKYGLSLEIKTREDELKLGLYHTYINITKINGVKLG